MNSSRPWLDWPVRSSKWTAARSAERSWVRLKERSWDRTKCWPALIVAMATPASPDNVPSTAPITALISVGTAASRSIESSLAR